MFCRVAFWAISISVVLQLRIYTFKALESQGENGFFKRNLFFKFIPMKLYLNTLLSTGNHWFLSYHTRKSIFSILKFFDSLEPHGRRRRRCTGGFFENQVRLSEAVTFDLVIRIM